MKLKRIKTHAFRSIQDSEIEFGEFTLLAGKQGAGKSSHLHSITAALTGRTPHTDRGGKGLKDSIRRDQAKAEIELVCQFAATQPDCTIRRTITEGAQTLEVPFGGKNLSARQALLTERLGGVDEVPDVLLDPRIFAERDVKEQNQCLIKILRAPVIEVPAAAKAAGIQELKTVQNVDDHIKSIKDGAVRSLNAVIDELERTCPEEPNPEELEAARKAEDAAAQLDARIQSLALEVQNAQFLLDDARRQAEEVEQARVLVAELPGLRTAQQNVQADEAKLVELDASLRVLENELKNARSRSLKMAAAKEATEKLPSLRKALEDWRAQLQLAASEYKAKQQELSDARVKASEICMRKLTLTNAIDDLTKLSGKCPTCSRKLTDKAKTELLAEMQAEYDKAKGDSLEADGNRQALETAVAAEGLKGSDARKKVDRLTKEVSDAERVSADISESGCSEEEIEAKHLPLREKFAAIKLTYLHEDDSPTLRGELNLLASRIADAERAEKFLAAEHPDVDALEKSLLCTSRDRSEAIDQHEAAKAAAQAGREVLRRAEDFKAVSARLTTERTKRERYEMAKESLIALKDSILGGEAAKKLQFDCTAIFQEFFPQAHVILDPTGASVAPIGSSDGTPVDQLSSGQKVIFDMGLRIAAAKSTGFNLLAIDDANKLAPSAREGMRKCLMASGCQVIMCTTADKIGPIPGAVVYSVSNPGVWGPTTVERVGG
jgi:DNA repair exonuclease SbcCD ATPase subunit